MKHENGKPKRELPKKIVSGIGRAARGVVDGIGEVLEDGIVGSVAQVRRAHKEIAESGGLLGASEVRRLEIDKCGSLVTDTIGSETKDVTHLIVAGGTMFGVVRTSELDAGGVNRLSDIAIVELPYGHNKQFAGDPADLSPQRVVASVDPSTLAGRKVDGVINEQETVIVGRAGVDGADPGMSRKHFSVTFMPDGALELSDNYSTNRTTCLGSIEYGKILAKEGMMPSDTRRLVSDLVDNPTKYDPSLAGIAVVD